MKQPVDVGAELEKNAADVSQARSENKAALEAVLEELIALIRQVDPLELMGHAEMLVEFWSADEPDLLADLREGPTLYVLSGLCLHYGELGTKAPTLKELWRAFELSQEYVDRYSTQLLLDRIAAGAADDEEAPFLARLQTLIRATNPNTYEFQLDQLLQEVFVPFDDYFVGEFGFSASDAIKIGQEIIALYEKRLHSRSEDAREAQNFLKETLVDHESALAKAATATGLTDAQVIERYNAVLSLTNLTNIFAFTPEDLASGEINIDQVRAFLAAVQCVIPCNESFDAPIADNIVSTNPIVALPDGRYFAPIPTYLRNRMPDVLEALIRGRGPAKTVERYLKNRGKFAEDLIEVDLLKLFPRKSVFRNLYYSYQGQRVELDFLVLYDDKAVIVESKAGHFTAPARRGAKERLATDLRKLIEAAHEQGVRTRSFITSEKSVRFQNEKGQTVLQIKRQDISRLFLVSVTLEPLMHFNTDVRKLRSLGLFKQGEVPWSVHLFEFDVITSHIGTAEVFLHYVSRRTAAQEEGVLQGIDELSFFGYYLAKGNFIVPRTDDDRRPTMIHLQPDWSAAFDDEYVR